MISDTLKRIYSNYNESRIFYDALELSHPNFINTHYIVRANKDATLNIGETAGSELVIFRAYPFNVVLPEVGSDQQDIGIVFDNVSKQMIDEIEAASASPEYPIKMKYRVYLIDSPESQITPIELTITSLNVTATTVSATATRSNLYARRFPFGNTSTYNRRFSGLYL